MTSGRLGLPEEILPDLQSAPNAADGWAGVESRANLVVAKVGSETFQPVQRWGEIFVHPGWRLAAARPRKADRADMPETRALRGCRLLDEQNRGHAAGSERLHDIGRPC